MTAEEKKRLAGLVGLLDSDQVGEREAALGKIHILRDKAGWPGFADLWRKADSAISPDDFEKVEKNLAQWKQAHDAKAAENATLARRNTALAARVTALRAGLFLKVNWRRMAALGVVAALSVSGWRWANADAAPDNPAASGTAADPDQAAITAAMRSVLTQTKWTDGDTPAAAWRMSSGDHWWVVVRGGKDLDSHTDARGRPVERHCLKLYAAKAVPDGGAFLAPHPYLLGSWMKWPERAAECRLPGKAGY